MGVFLGLILQGEKIVLKFFLRSGLNPYLCRPFGVGMVAVVSKSFTW
jgi:hypothetical protein